MNAAGLTFVMGGVSSVLGMSFFDTLVSSGQIAQEELDGLRSDVAAVVTTLKNTPGAKIEAMVDQYNDELSQRLNDFDAQWTQDYLTAFRDAEVMTGYVATIMAKSGLSE